MIKPHAFPLTLLAAFALALPTAHTQEILAEDYGSDGAYGGGWGSGSNGGRGFGPWTFREAGNVYEYSHSGFGTRDQHPTLGDKVFSMWANGEYFEVAAAFRSLSQPLQPGDTFSLVMDNGPFERRFDNDDPEPGSIGFSLRSSDANETWDLIDYEARLVFGFFEGYENYQLFDGSGDPDTGVPFSPTGVYVGVKITSADTYEIEIKTLGENQVPTVLKDRELMGEPGASINAFSIFNRDGEKNDAYFNSFRVFR
jgi:hypothetical protein